MCGARSDCVSLLLYYIQYWKSRSDVEVTRADLARRASPTGERSRAREAASLRCQSKGNRNLKVSRRWCMCKRAFVKMLYSSHPDVRVQLDNYYYRYMR